ncbi:hypothetical protein [Halopelagius longus]|uniref:DUF8156 domain-containing protein n=1 Tax=Halopelagius longus TaxID=1236180 RepID=A0A370IPK4_9EURY|nr:hypothetical protein [Halopelagius longus]RDI72657.1 hypothetical protein DWB78_13515 [Halopelagius longus]
MGRTNPTFRDTIRAVEDDWSDFRRALRRRDQPHFDRLFDHVRAHADAAGYLNHRTPEIPMIVSIVLEQERRIDELEAHVDQDDVGDQSTR